ncbi:hypothetical protein DXG01_004427 [Tephrocybe rancida]|nr:hypothetical protein DXG01_004427 [Tephrocybe rancida]
MAPYRADVQSLAPESIPLPSTVIDVSCFSERYVKRTAYSQIKKDIATLKRSILALKERYNTLNITARLPDELLAQVFKWNLSMQLDDKKTPWLQVSGVCTVWRRVALACPHLWSFIRQRGMKWLKQVILPRSMDVPLHIGVTLHRRQGLQGLLVALKEIHRVRELTVLDDASDPVRIHNLLAGFTKAAPMLEILNVNTWNLRIVYQLPDNLFNNAAPNLRTLRLTSCTIPPTCPLLSGLTTLVMDDLSSNEGKSLLQLMVVLAAAPNLENLKLRNPIIFEYYDAPNLPSPATRISLLRLKRLVLGGELASSLSILSGLNHPATTQIELSGYVPFGIMQSHRDIVAARSLSDELSSCLGSIHLLKITGSKDHPISDVYGRRGDDDSERHLHISHFSLDVLETLFKPFRPEVLEVHYRLPVDFWLDTFGKTLGLKAIHIEGEAPELIEALGTSISDAELAIVAMDEHMSQGALPPRPDPLRGHLRFNSLRSLQIRSWNGKAPAFDITLLGNTLHARAVRGFKLRQLSAKQCTHYLPTNADEDVSRIFGAVESVNWDVAGGLLPVVNEGTYGTVGRRRNSDPH